MMKSYVQLSEHFTLAEFCRSDEADKLNIDNKHPTEMQLMRMGALCDNVLEPIRKYFGKPVRILSGWRSPELNEKIGGVADSQHVRGEAADITVDGVSHVELFNFIITHLSFDQCIAEKIKKDDLYSGWIHVSFCTAKKRQQILSFLGDGKYVAGLQFV